MVITLGHEYAGIFANDEELAEQLIKAAAEAAATSCGGCRWPSL